MLRTPLESVFHCYLAHCGAARPERVLIAREVVLGYGRSPGRRRVIAGARMGDLMKPARWLGFVVVGVVLLGLAACSTPTGSGGGTTVGVTTVGTVPWLAAQDGSGAWQTLSGSSFTVTNSGGRFGVAWECTMSSGQPLVEVVQATTVETTSVTASCPTVSSSTQYTVSGTVSGIPVSGSAYVAAGNSTALATYSGFGSYTLPSVALGEQTLLAYGLTSTSTYDKMGRTTVAVSGNLTGENVTLTNQITTANTLSLSGVPSGESPALAVGLAPTATAIVTIAGSSSASLTYPLVPSGLALTGDKYVLFGVAQSSGEEQIAAVVSQSPTSGASLQLPTALSLSAGVGVTATTATATWGSVTFPTGTGLGFSVAAVSPTSLTSPAWEAVVTSGWLGSATSYVFPDFTATTGWNTNWDFPTSQSATAAVLAYQANVTLSQFQAFSQTQNYATLPNGTGLGLTEEVATGTY